MVVLRTAIDGSLPLCAMGKRRQPADQQILHTMTLQCLQDLVWIERTARVVTHDSWLVFS